MYKQLILIAALVLSAPCSAMSFTIWGYIASEDFDGQGNGSFTAPGLVIKPEPSRDYVEYFFEFDLADSESITQQLGTIWTDELSIDADDRVPQNVFSRLYIDTPTQTAMGFTGTTVGKTSQDGSVQWGELSWDSPKTLHVVDEFQDPLKPIDYGFLTVALYGGQFNKGLGGLCPGRECGALDIRAAFTYHDPVAPVPIPPAFGLFLLAIGWLGWQGRRAGRKVVNPQSERLTAA